MGHEIPDVVQTLMDAVGEKLGRPDFARKVMNRNEWFVQDLILSFVQHGMKKGQTGYRIGFSVDLDEDELWFRMVHSPIIAKIFKQNISYSLIRKILLSTQAYREVHGLFWSSKGVKFARLSLRDINDFIGELDSFEHDIGFVNDLFPTRQNTGKGVGTAPVAGNTFYLKLAENLTEIAKGYKIAKLIDMALPLFLCLYPTRPIQGRAAGLARSMKFQGIVKTCEFSFIGNLPTSIIISPCVGTIQGARIKPHSRGGSDRAENGLWLCENHHRLTEGRLKGRRSLTEIEVNFLE